jgi:endoglucanase
MTQDPREQVFNGCFNDKDTAGWYATKAQMSVDDDGILRAKVTALTQQNKFDDIIGQDDIVLRKDRGYTLSFTASASQPLQVGVRVQVKIGAEFRPAFGKDDVALTTDPQQFTFTFACPVDDTDHGQLGFHLGGHPVPWTFSLDDVSLVGGDPFLPLKPDTGPRVRVNQVGYLPFGPKRATVVTDASAPLTWQVNDSAGHVVLSGISTPRGEDPSSGEKVHTVDFSGLTATGTGFTLSADGQTSHPFGISATLYGQLRSDALHFFYLQRSGIDIKDELAPGYARPAGHVGKGPNKGDKDVPCQSGVGGYRLDVSGGWYDAGDLGKYVVNGGITTYQLLSQYERAKNRTPTGGIPDALGDGSLHVPERGNGVPDILDEARHELEFLLRMRVPAGETLAGMAHHKVHDQHWTDLPCAPDQDPEVRELHPPSTAATLNLAAVAAQAARLYRPFDQAFADRCLAAARTAWDAARAHPTEFARPEDSNGGGPYAEDKDEPERLDDEFYWAAAELFITTSEQTYLDALRVSQQRIRASQQQLPAEELWIGEAFPPHGFSWQSVAALGRLDLATVPSRLPDADRDAARASVRAAADRYLDTAGHEAYGMPLAANEYDWGSNSALLNKLVVIATAFDLTNDKKYRDGVLEGLDYIFGRNALNQSYVTGYGDRHSHNQHSRIYAQQKDDRCPPPPAGAIAGGPNTGLQDPKAAKTLLGTQKDAKPPKPQFCYLDDIMSWSTNEVAINWNAALSWVGSFAADLQTVHVPEMATAPTRT